MQHPQDAKIALMQSHVLPTAFTLTAQRRQAMQRLLAFLLIAVAVPPGWAQLPAKPVLEQLLQLAGTAPDETAPDPTQLVASPTRDQQLPLFRAVMARPLDAPFHAGMLAEAYADAAASPHALMGLTGGVAGLRSARSIESALDPLERALRGASDPLAASLVWMGALATKGSNWPPPLPDMTRLPNPLRFELAMVLSAMSQSHQLLQRAFAKLPKTVTPALLRRQALDGDFLSLGEPDYRQLLALVDREALLAGMLDLVAAVERLQRFVTNAPHLPAVAWTLDTPMGRIVVDTTGQDNRYRLKDALLVLDVGGDDQYEFLPRSDCCPISVLLDHQGNDRYVATAPGADPSSATLGFGILWDTEGDDSYRGTQQAQASALFGAALLVDSGGNNQFVATSHSQAHAIGGLAVLLSGTGNDQFTAQTQAQGSAGPQGVAVLIDPAGNDRYTLDNTPLINPSPQLPDRNTSMGQGAGYGIRANSPNGRSSAGGIGLLLDLAGDDRYVAQVFAQGVGYYEGLGLLVDSGGSDHFDAAWYAMGAAAHKGAGVLLKRGTGDDSYRASHSIALGAAHDFSVGIFLDEGGNDHYEVGDLGLGAAHDNSTALFVDAAGDDAYQLTSNACRALGAAHISDRDAVRDDLPNLGLFMDLGGNDTYPVHCAQARNNSKWTSPRRRPTLNLRGEAGAGIDGERPMPFGIRAQSAQRAPGNWP
jgi:hypothetical protein